MVYIAIIIIHLNVWQSEHINQYPRCLVPSTPPENMTVVAVSPFAVEVEWNPPATPNGVIIHYNVYTSNLVLVDTVNSSQRNYVYGGLAPYQNVSVCVSASTSVGEGPKSQPVSTRTRESGLSVTSNRRPQYSLSCSSQWSWEFWGGGSVWNLVQCLLESPSLAQWSSDWIPADSHWLGIWKRFTHHNRFTQHTWSCRKQWCW